MVLVNWFPCAHISASPLCLPCQGTLAQTDLEATSWLSKGHRHRVRKRLIYGGHKLCCVSGDGTKHTSCTFRYLGLISNGGNWSSVLTISGRDLPPAFSADGQSPTTCPCPLHGERREPRALAKAVCKSLWQPWSHGCCCPGDADKGTPSALQGWVTSSWMHGGQGHMVPLDPRRGRSPCSGSGSP